MMPEQRTVKMFMAKYKCRGCLYEFNFSNHTGSSVRCPRCRGGACDPLTPAANIFVGSRVATTREAKITRYQARSAKMIGKFQEHFRVFRTFLEVLEVSKDMKRRVSEVLDEALREARQIRTDKIALHESHSNESKDEQSPEPVGP